MKVDIWSDVVCPWCYVGKRRFELALAGFEHADDVEVRWHAFELDPSAPKSHPGSDYAGRLADKYGMTRDRAEDMLAGMTATAAEAGLDFDFSIAQPGNTFDAHRLLHLAAARGRQDEVKERFLAATFTEGRAIADPATLLDLSVEAGLDGDEVAAVLETDAWGREVRDDEALAHSLGITAVPFFVLDERYGVSGAQSPEVLRAALQEAWNERGLRPLVAAPAGDPACDDGSCPI
jgi:predicted DsbA family dithiol-disulfide isomerase